MLSTRLCQWLVVFALAAGATVPSCSTKAVGVDECRRIEDARCEAAANCPEQFGATDVQQCKLFYRDHCLHGLPVSAAPTGAAVRQCVEAINDLSKCAAGQQGAAALLADCAEPVVTTKPSITRVCKLLAEPEAIRDCGFLKGDPSGAEGGASGDDGSGGTSAASGGTGTGPGGSSATGQAGSTDLSGFGGLTL